MGRAAMKQETKPELLAPAGHVESFYAAIESGADAVYLGLKNLSARATATNFTLGELAAMIPFARNRGAAVYVALNSLVTSLDLAPVLDILQALQDLECDALIIQDPGLFTLCRNHFPSLQLHASTLCAAHNTAGVDALAAAGAQRVVLARELTFDEIRTISRSTSTAIEIFVHGALCFSLSGLCLASSFRGGHSGLQGRCVQPCRLRFRQGRQEGYFLSCNDLAAISWLPRLMSLGLAAFKIEGRMKTADYIAQVVKAYRLVMDAAPEARRDAVQEARRWLNQAPARRLTTACLAGKPDDQILTPHRSGSSGLWVATVRKVSGKEVQVVLRHQLQAGDRLRIESAEGRQREAFTVVRMKDLNGRELERAEADQPVVLTVSHGLEPGQRLFRVGTRNTTSSQAWQRIRRKSAGQLSFRQRFQGSLAEVFQHWPQALARRHRSRETLVLKVGLQHQLAAAFQSPAETVILKASKANLEKVARTRLHKAQKRRLCWSLPAVIWERDLDYYRRAVDWFVRRGYRSWEVNNWGHFRMLPNTDRLRISAGYRFNLRNAAALATLAEHGCAEAALSLEMTREELARLAQQPLAVRPVVCLYAWPPLFLSRLPVRLREDKPVVTPKNDVYFYRKSEGLTAIYADRPINWMEKAGTLRALGYRCFLIDISEGPRDQTRDLSRLLSGYKRDRADEPYSLFNFEKKPFAVGQAPGPRR